MRIKASSTSLYKYPRSNYCIYGALILALKYLIFMGQLIKEVVLENLLDLVELVLQLGIVNGVNIEDNAKRICDLLRPLAHVKSLGLTTKTTKAIKATFVNFFLGKIFNNNNNNIVAIEL